MYPTVTAVERSLAALSLKEKLYFSDLPEDVKRLIFQAASFDHWYDEELQNLFFVNWEWHSLLKRALLEQSDRRGFYISQILAKAGYKLDCIDPAVKDIVLSDRCRKSIQNLEIDDWGT